MVKEFVSGISLKLILDYIAGNDDFIMLDDNIYHYKIYNSDVWILPLDNQILSKTVSVSRTKVVISGNDVNVKLVYDLFFYHFLSAGG